MDEAAVRARFVDLAAVVFDFDGVLVDSVDVKSAAFAALYPDESEAFRARVVRHHLAHGGVSRHRKIAHYERLRTGEPATDSRVAELADRFARLVVDQVIAAPAMPGAEELLRHLGAAHPLFVCSGTPEPELRDIVRARGWTGHFAAVFGSPATKAEILARTAATLGCPPSALLLVGDASTDREGARAAGARFILVGPGHDAGAGEEPRVDDPAALLRILAP